MNRRRGSSPAMSQRGVGVVVRAASIPHSIDFGPVTALHTDMTQRARPSVSSHPEFRFWACFAVVMALLTQVFFPPQVMAADTAHGPSAVLCSAGLDAAPIADPVLLKALHLHKSGLQGLKCASCVLASITAIATPDQTFVPIVYAVAHADYRPATMTAPVGARAPPRPFSCGPPSLV